MTGHLNRRNCLGTQTTSCTLCVILVAFAASPLGSTEPGRLVTVRSGQLPIILSAPHGGRDPVPNVAPRQGEGVNQFVVVRDEHTAELTIAIADELAKRVGARPFLVIARFDRKYVDANRNERSAIEDPLAQPYYRAYHQALEEFTSSVQKKWKRGLLLDIHGQAKLPDALVRGTNNGQTVELMITRHGRQSVTGSRSLFGAFAGTGHRIVPPVDSDESEDARFLGGFIVRNYGSHTASGIDAMQLEFGTNLRQQKSLTKTAAAMAEAIEVFCKQFFPEALRRPMP
jgi:N-formylglutamate amidohydrolase